ncbi:MAG: branched-chain amino acid transaminase [Halobacteria archaeon]|nr:branched-chain amino acid transaminase [Halobacteria archaeon]
MAFDDYDVDKIWMDGELVDWEDAKIHVLSHVIHYGSGVFEGIRCYETVDGPAVFRHRAHYERLQNSAKTMRMDLEYSTEELMAETRKLIDENGLESCYIRPLVYYGYNSLGVNPGDCPVRTMIAVWPWGAYLGEEALEKGVDVQVSSWRRYHSSQIPTTAKVCGGYINSMLANEQARARGYIESILLNKEGDVAEGSGENLFLVEDGTIYTPGLDSSILDGITRRTVIEIARDLGYEVVEKRIALGELYRADELFFSGTAAEVTPIRKVDDVVIGDGTRGPITEEIQSTFFDIVEGRNETYRDWLDFV